MVIGIFLVAVCGLSIIISLARGSIAGLPFNVAFAILGILSFRQGVLSLREEVAKAPGPSGPEPVSSGQSFRQWLRTYRSSLIWVPAVAIAVAGVAELIRRTQIANSAREAEERAAVRTLKNLGGRVMGTNDGHPDAISLERSEETRMFEGQNSGLREVMDDDVDLIAAFRDLDRLYIKGPEITDAGLRRLAPQPKLTVFAVNCPLVTEEGLRVIATMVNLEFLNLSGTSVRSLSTFDFARKVRLRRLDLSNTSLKNDSASEVALLNLRELDLSATNIDDDCLRTLARLSNLEELHLAETQVTDRGILELQSLSKLKVLDVVDTEVTEGGAKSLKQRLPHCSVYLK
jgi:hypothetical protein